MTRLFVACAVLLLPAAMASPAAGAPFSWNNIGGAGDPIQIQSASILPSDNPLRAASIPVRWDAYYDPATDAVVETFLTFGTPTGFPAPGGLHVAVPAAGNVVGSATYTLATPVPIAAGTYAWSRAGPANSQNAMSIAVTNDVEIAGVELTVEKKIFGVFIEIPALPSSTRGDVNWDDTGDYYLRSTFYDATDARLGAYEFYFTFDADAFPAETDSLIAYHALPVPEPASGVALLLFASPLATRRGRGRCSCAE